MEQSTVESSEQETGEPSVPHGMAIMRWLAIPLLTVVICVISVLFTFFLAWNGMHRFWVEPLASFLGIAASLVMIGLLAPRWQRIVPLICSAIGLFLFYHMINWFDPITQQPTVFPFFAGVAGAAVGLAANALRIHLGSRSIDPRS